ncbi:MAG: hypothetical protein K8I04_07285 [Gammaproteobacteria bacterium]|nr:hypothetical protein [Gammaproteobacteria bacterium]
MFKRAYVLCAVLLLSTLLAGCGGGGSSSSTPVATADATGVWEGTITQNGVGTFSVTGLITGGQMRFLSADGYAIVADDTGMNDILVFTVPNANVVIVGVLDRI